MRLLNEILLPADFSSRSLEIARYAVGVARHFHATLTLLHVLPPLNPAWVAMGNAVAVDELIVRQKEEHYARLNSFLPDDIHNLSVKRLIVEGDPGLLGRLRTHSYSLIRESPCPVISI